MKKTPFKFLSSSASLFGMTAIFFVVFFLLLQRDSAVKKDLEDLHILSLSAERVRNLDYAGTTGIRLSAILKTDAYILHYQDLQDRKYEALNEFFDHSQREAVKDAFYRLAEIQEELEDMESEAIALIDERNWAAAWKLVNDPVFTSKKRVYSENLSDLLQEIIVVSENQIAQSKQLNLIERYLVLAIFVLICLIGFRYSRVLRRSLEHERELSGRLEDMNENLERRVLERTNELKKANLIKDEFLASMSHELRTPLTAIIGNAELLSGKVESAEMKELVSSTEAAGNVLLSLVNDILDISKIESGLFLIEEVSFNLSHLLNQVRNILKDSAAEKGLTLIVEAQNDIPDQLLGDPKRIRQVLINLVGNAIKFTTQGEVRLTTSVDDGWLRLIVKDSGIGMSEAEQARLFKKFQQVDGSISRRYGGSGLGLYISFNLAELMGGSVSVVSQKGQGSAFTFAVPFRRSDLRVTKPEKPAEPDLVRFSGSVLVVEDTKPIQMILKRLLESLGLAVTVVENGREAVEILGRRSFDLIFMDMQMPIMDGIEATTIIRVQGIQTPLYAVTANVFDKDRARFEQAGCTGFLSKPVVKKELSEVIIRHLPVEAT